MNLLMLAQESTPTILPDLFYLAPIGAVVALIMAFVFSRGVMAHSEGEPEMIRIAEHVRAGAMAYLKRQYKVVFVVFVLLVAILALLGIQWTIWMLECLKFCHELAMLLRLDRHHHRTTYQH